ncbi:MAG: 4-hydroxy-tetrahydrodipicolinate reductase [Bacteroidales bacterium]|nr:4-hydroxy-tetrahydrodipicolinate reductase [Candidatus Cryptobacteroides choladohippi]MCQ2179685.1 4-hydroxy-tetrahydrodipicolinate reductase [Bacteroidales bacterium]
MKIIISGYGKMGHMVEVALLRRGLELAEASEDVCSVDPALAAQCVCIDFTTPAAFRENYKWMATHFKAVVVGTTGWDDIFEDVVGAFNAAGTPMVYSSNYSIGVNAVFAALEKVGSILKGNGYVPHIEEIHHVHKLDAPSGTAKTMASIVDQSLGIRPDITSIRQGEVPGTHVVKFKSEVDKIKISHEAFSREGFADGAVLAAILTEGLVGVHSFKELILK